MDTSLGPTCAFIFRAEGGYSGIQQDAGNWTGGRIGAGTLIGSNMGISAPVLAAWMARTAPTVRVTAAVMRALPQATATAILAAKYWNVLRAGGLPAGIDLLATDFGFNAGEVESAIELQRALGFAEDDVDGWIGPDTLAAAAREGAPLIDTLAAAHVTHYRGLAQFPTFGRGWLDRVERGRIAAHALVPAGKAVPVHMAGTPMQQSAGGWDSLA